MKKIGSIVLLMVLVLGILAFSGCSSGSSSPTPKGEGPTGGVIRVGMECNYAPFNWTQANASADTVALSSGGHAGGYDVEIAKRIAAGLGMELEIVKTEWAGLIPAVQSGKIDLVIAGMSPREDRKVSVDFSDAYYESELVVVVRKDGGYADAKSLEELSGAKITGQLSTFHYDVIDQIPGVQIQNAMEDFPAMAMALQSGKIDGYVSERPGALSAVASNSDLTFVEFEEGKGFEASTDDTSIAVAVAKGKEDLLTKINGILAGISVETREQLMREALENQPLSE